MTAESISKLRREIMLRHKDEFVFDDDGRLLDPPKEDRPALALTTRYGTTHIYELLAAKSRPVVVPAFPVTSLHCPCGGEVLRSSITTRWECQMCGLTVTDHEVFDR